MQQNKPYRLEQIRDFLKRLYDWGKGRTYNTQDSTKSILDCLINVVDINIDLQKRIEILESLIQRQEKLNETK